MRQMKNAASFNTPQLPFTLPRRPPKKPEPGELSRDAKSILSHHIPRYYRNPLHAKYAVHSKHTLIEPRSTQTCRKHPHYTFHTSLYLTAISHTARKFFHDWEPDTLTRIKREPPAADGANSSTPGHVPPTILQRASR